MTISVFSQENKTDASIRKQIENYNAAFAVALVENNKNAVSKSYTDQSVLMPEHSRQRVGKKAIAGFYEQWLTQAKVNSYEKTIFELQDFGDYVLEIGNFTENLHLKDLKPYVYSGKYMVVWKKAVKNKMTIAAEIWGANSYFDDRFIPEIDDSHVVPTKGFTSSDKLISEVIEKNASIKNLVQNRMGAEHAKMFMPDAMYLTYYMPILSGEKDITAYFTEHEKPGTLKIEQISIQTSGVIVAKKAIIEFGFYNVGWRDGTNHGNVKGKSINVWKRNDKGELMLFRQMVNHD
ncbi:YybH family protein [Flavobacterium anhuiense]|uniref:YybH family protein n=1 Tax=Flavobacterium anhuiense TaxID=459526 RepID=UPI003D95F8B4